MGQYDQAISDYTKAIEINANNAYAYCNRGSVYDDKGLYDKAIADFNKAIEIIQNSHMPIVIGEWFIKTRDFMTKLSLIIQKP